MDGAAGATEKMGGTPWLVLFLKSFEKFAPKVYKDQAGHPTIGYGHLIKGGEVFSEITEDEAEELLAKDIGIAAGALRSLVNVSLSFYEEEALTSLIFNIGQAAFSTSTIRSLVNDNRMIEAAHQFRRWCRAGGQQSAGLLRRRVAEELRFLGGHEQSSLDIAAGVWK